MDAPPSDDAHVQHIPLLPSSPRPRPRRVKPHKAPGKTALLLVLGVSHIACNVVILFVVFRGYRFGNRIGKDSWWITDNSMLAVLQPCSNILYTVTALLGGWAMSHLWSRRLSSRSAAGLAEMQSFQIYGSIPTILSSIVHIFNGHYISAQWLYAAVIISAILLQFYTAAIVTLITPSPTIVKHPQAYDSVLDAPFMSSQGYGYSRCVSPLALPEVVNACREIMLSGTALIDIEHFDGAIHWTNQDSPWVEVDTSYSLPGRFVSAAVPLGPYNNYNFSDGAQLYGINMATVERMSNIDNIWNSFSFSILVYTHLPILTCLCARQGPATANISSIDIHGTTYMLSTPVPPLEGGQIVAQVTSNNMTLVISIPSSRQPTSNIHCAINLTLQLLELEIVGTSNTGLASMPLGASGTLLVYPPFEHQNISEPTPQPIRDFADVWLQGLGWGSTATQALRQ
ncbi:hypothetical protein NLI96_g4405 [Meripilus lineatus]|uniref:Uncharacterized protein n=1 Tax=Meripilus lineatus TaxID=2056292 RepID=A0AAD5V4Y9_9APHY|nr:hypothetical protein NLI96_g4405 [Physisporinus lineatus]